MEEYLDSILSFIPEELVTYMQEHPWFSLGYFVLFLIITKIVLKYSLKILRYLYHRKMSAKLIYMQVIQPRADTTKDKEEAVEKDFKERVAIMEQLYRSIHEMAELNLWNAIKVKLFHYDFVSFEIVAQKKIVDFYVITHSYYAELVEKQITAFYKDADVQPVKPYHVIQKGLKTKSYYLFLKRPFYFPIRTYKILENDPLNDMTNVLSKLEEEEIGAIQLVLRPRTDKKWRKKAEDAGTALFKGKKVSGFHMPGSGIFNSLFVGLLFGYEKVQKEEAHGGGDPLVRMLQSKEEDAKSIGEKFSQSAYDCVIRLVASAKTTQRAEIIANNMVLSFNVFKHDTRNYFQNRRVIPIDWLNNKINNHNFTHRFPNFFEKSSLLVCEELASIYHFPTSRYNYTPVIRWLLYKSLPAPTNLPYEGLLLGINEFRGMKKDVRIKKNDRTRHQYIIGKSGSGKSALLSYMARQDAQNGEGLCVIDPHGDLIEDILAYIPKERAKSVIVFDPSDTERPMGLNILEAKTAEQQDMTSSQATEIFIKLFGDEIFGPRIQHYFRNACLTLMEDQEEGATLIDVPRVFTDDDFMKYKVSKVKNPVVRSFWEHEYAHTGERERQEMIPYFSAKFGPFITNSIMRNTIGQTKSSFSFREAMDHQKILLVNLSKGKIGDLNTQLLGLVLVARIQMAAMSRVDIAEEERKDFFLYVDEFQNFATESFCSILSEARKYHLALIMAHQYINQLVVSKFGNSSTQIRDAVFGNCGTIMSFKVGAEDAEYLAKEYAPVLSEQDIIGIANYKAYLKLLIDNAPSRPFSLQTIWDPSKASPKIRDLLKEYCRMKYGRKKIFVEQEISARIGIDITPSEPSENQDPSSQQL